MKQSVLVAGFEAKESAALGLSLLRGGYSAVLAPDMDAALTHLRGGRVDAVLVSGRLAESGEAGAQEFRKQAAVWRISLFTAAAGAETPALVRLLSGAARPQKG